MRSQIFRQIVHKFRRHTDVCQGICVQDAGKYASRCATKPSGGLCAVLPYALFSVAWIVHIAENSDFAERIHRIFRLIIMRAPILTL